MDYPADIPIDAQQHITNFWETAKQEAEELKSDQSSFRTQDLPLARIKKIMKLDDDVRTMVGGTLHTWYPHCSRWLVQKRLSCSPRQRNYLFGSWLFGRGFTLIVTEGELSNAMTYQWLSHMVTLTNSIFSSISCREMRGVATEGWVFSPFNHTNRCHQNKQTLKATL